jgi:ABC-type phosphate transport system substrate-binding protein
MIVPFAFWANNSLQVDKCAQNAALTEKHVGQVCDKNNAGFPCDVAADCKTQPLDDLSRIQAANILSGSIGDVSQLGPSYSTTSGGGADTFIRVCLRHAGSGTQSTLHNAVENADKWVAQKLAIDGDSLCNPGSVGDTNTYQGGVLTALNWPACLPANVATNADLQSFIFFNDSTDDLLNCVNSTPNAIGIADADACNAATANASPYITPASNVYNTNLCANIHSLSYNGYAPTRWNVRDGLYEFWTKENLYLNQHLYPSTSNEYKFFTAFNSAISPSFLTYAKVGDSAYIWATTAEMNYSKLDKTHPGYSGGGTQKP